MPGKKTAINLILNITRVGLNLLFPLVTFPYISKVLGPVNLGKVNFTASVINYFVLIASMGIPSYGVIICAKAKEDKERLKQTVCELLYINFSLVIVAYTLFLFSLISVKKFEEYRTLFFVQSISIVLTAAGVDWLYSALEDFTYITFRSIGFKLISAVLIFTCVRKQDDYIIYALILIFSTIGSCVLNFLHAKPYIKFYPIKDLNLKRHIKPILTFFAASVAATISSSIDTTMLGFFYGDYEVGIYSFAVKIKNLLVTVNSAILAVFVPQFSVYAQRKAYELYKLKVHMLAQFMYVLACAMTCFVIAFSSDIILILGGEEYYPARLPMYILTSCLIVLSMTWTLGIGVLQPLGMEKIYTKGVTISCVVNVLFNVGLIPFWGTNGASIATLVSEVTLMIYFINALKGSWTNILKTIKWIQLMICCAIAAVVSQYVSALSGSNLYVKVMFSFGIYCLILGTLIMTVNKEIREWIIAKLKTIHPRRNCDV